MPQTTLIVEPIKAGQDNIIWMLPTSPTTFAAVDPGHTHPVTDFLTARRATLSHILITHHHADHTGGVDTLRQRYQAQVIGALADVARLPTLDQTVVHGDQVPLGEKIVAQVMAVPGHTTGHLVYLINDALFSGDTLFGFGCGRLFEGTPQMMWNSLLQLRNLPETTRLFAGHEYTLANLAFVADLEPDHTDLITLRQEMQALITAGQLTLPHPLSLEKRFNPFWRADHPDFAARLGLTGKAPIEVFSYLRTQRNHFKI